MLKNIVSYPASTQPVLQQHIEDAAFYWLRRQDGLWKPAFKANNVAHLDRLVDAHLEGVLCGGDQAITIALERLAQWKTADEVFVSTYALIHQQEKPGLPQLASLIDHESASGASAAFFWSRSKEALSLANQWWQSDVAHLRQAAAPFLLSNSQSNDCLSNAANDPNPNVRAQVYKAIGELGLKQYVLLLESALSENDMQCRFEAAIALCLLGEATVDTSIISEAIPHLGGLTQRRAILIWAATCSNDEFKTWIASQSNHRIILWAIAFRGDCRYLSRLCDFLIQGIEPKLTAYVICHLTELNYENKEYWVSPEKEIEQEDDDDFTEKQHSEDDGLLTPEAEALVAWIERYSEAGELNKTEPRLNGEPLRNIAKETYVNGWQPQRWQAGFYLAQKDNEKAFLTLEKPLYNLS